MRAISRKAWRCGRTSYELTTPFCRLKSEVARNFFYSLTRTT
jgi:hypothetical protein